MTETQRKEDYRSSHLQRGGNYDARLAESPFDAYMAIWERRHLSSILPKLFPAGPQRYLDFACGTGRITEQIAPFCVESVAVDISASMIEVARTKAPNTRFHLADLTREDLDCGDFDLITSFRFFGNAQDELREAALKAMLARLRPGGRLVINNHRNPMAVYAVLDRLTGGNADGMDLSMGKLRRLLTGHGLAIEILQPIGAWMYRARMMATACPDDDRARANEARFGHPRLAPFAPAVIVVARKS